MSGRRPVVHQSVRLQLDQRVDVVGGGDAQTVETADLAHVAADLVRVAHSDADQLEQRVLDDLRDHHPADEARTPHHDPLGHRLRICGRSAGPIGTWTRALHAANFHQRRTDVLHGRLALTALGSAIVAPSRKRVESNMGIATRVNGAPPPDVPLDEIDLASWDFWAQDDDIRDGAFATLRREAPISFWEEIEAEGFEAGPGHWALTKYDDVHFASRHPHMYSSVPSIVINDQNPDLNEFFSSIIVMDDPRHHAAAQHRQPGIHAQGGGPHRGLGTRSGRRLVDAMIAKHPDGKGEARLRVRRTAAAAGDLRHGGHP